MKIFFLIFNLLFGNNTVSNIESSSKEVIEVDDKSVVETVETYPDILENGIAIHIMPPMRYSATANAVKED